MIPWIPLLTLGASLLGNIFGNNTSTTANQTTNQNVSGSGTSLMDSAEGQQSNTSTTQNGTSSTQQNSATSTTGNQLQTQTGVTTGTSSRLDSGTLGALTDQIKGLMQASQIGSAIDTNRLMEVAGTPDSFDPQAFVSGIMSQATSSADIGLESGMNANAEESGAGAGSNSAVALLNNKLKNATVANLAGINASATGAAQDIVRNNETAKTGEIASLTSGLDQNVQQLLSTLVSSQETQTQVQSGQTGTTTTGTTTGTTGTTTTDQQTQTGSQSQVATGQQGTDTTSKQNTSGTTSGTSNENKTDWTDFLKNLGSVLTTSF